jgi:hypothetical protein
MKKFNFYNAAFAASTLLAVLVIATELAKPFKLFLASIFSHHWIGKVVLITIAFVIIGFAYEKDKLFGIDSEKVSWYSVLGSIILIFLFYIIHFLT